ncbi:Smt3-specific protease, partial [Ascosphaera acerosa]
PEPPLIPTHPSEQPAQLAKQLKMSQNESNASAPEAQPTNASPTGVSEVENTATTAPPPASEPAPPPEEPETDHRVPFDAPVRIGDGVLDLEQTVNGEDRPHFTIGLTAPAAQAIIRMLTEQTPFKKLDWANAAQQEKLVRRRRANASEHAFFLDQRSFGVSSRAKSGLGPTEAQAIKTAEDLVAPFGYRVVTATTGELPPRRNLSLEERERIMRFTATSLDLSVVLSAELAALRARHARSVDRRLAKVTEVASPSDESSDESAPRRQRPRRAAAALALLSLLERPDGHDDTAAAPSDQSSPFVTASSASTSSASDGDVQPSAYAAARARKRPEFAKRLPRAKRARRERRRAAKSQSSSAPSAASAPPPSPPPRPLGPSFLHFLAVPAAPAAAPTTSAHAQPPVVVSARLPVLPDPGKSTDTSEIVVRGPATPHVSEQARPAALVPSAPALVSAPTAATAGGEATAPATARPRASVAAPPTSASSAAPPTATVAGASGASAASPGCALPTSPSWLVSLVQRRQEAGEKPWMPTWRDCELNAEIGVTSQDYDDLRQPDGWLSDAIIFAYLLLLAGAPGAAASRRYGILDPGYLHHLYYDEEGELELVGSARMIELARASDLLFAPVNLDLGHWILIVVDLRNHEVAFLDSEADDADEDDYIGRLQGWLWDCNALEPSVNLRVLDIAGPQQDNDNDCGVFVCANAWTIMRDGRLPLTDAFDSDEIDGFRAHMARELYLGVACPPPGSAEVWDKAKILSALQQGRPAHLGQGFDRAAN